MLCTTGDTVFRISDTCPAADIITVPGEYTFLSPYFWVIDRLSFPVGILIPSPHANSLQASTARYSAASSPGLLHGHIQFALKDMLFSPSARFAPAIFVSASATDNTEPLAGSIKAACGACPIEVAIPWRP